MANDVRAHVAQAALDKISPLLEEGSIIGLGTGATVDKFIELLSQSDIKYKYCVSSSKRTSATIARFGLVEADLSQISSVSIYIDGIDEGLDSGITVKGGAGALTREKVVATMASIFVTISGKERHVAALGAFPTPVEVMPYAEKAVIRTLQQWGASPVVRSDFTTDNGNIIVDAYGLDLSDPKAMEKDLNTIPGVIDNGIFAHRKADYMLFSDGVEISCMTVNDDILTRCDL